MLMGSSDSSPGSVLSEASWFASFSPWNMLGIRWEMALKEQLTTSQFTMLIGILIEMPFAVGEMLLGLEVRRGMMVVNVMSQAYLLRDWRTLQMVAYLPLLGELES